MSLFSAKGLTRGVKQLATYGIGAGAAYGVNSLIVNNVADPMWRRISQGFAAVAGSMMVANLARKPELGAAFGGAMMYPLIAEMTLMFGVEAAQGLGVNALSADLEAALEDGGELFLDGDMPEGGELQLW